MGKRSKISVKNKVKFSDKQYDDCLRKERFSSDEEIQRIIEVYRVKRTLVKYENREVFACHVLTSYQCKVCNGWHLTSI